MPFLPPSQQRQSIEGTLDILQWKTNRKSYVACRITPVLVTVNDLEGHSPVADLFEWIPSNICAAFYQISTDSVLAQCLSDSWASCSFLGLLEDLEVILFSWYLLHRKSCKKPIKPTGLGFSLKKPGLFKPFLYVYTCSVYWCWWTVRWTVLDCYKSTFTRQRTFL